MTVVTVPRIHLSQTLQSLIDSRLDTIERMLLGHVPRAERIAIVGEVESQIHELLGEREADDLSREDVLAVLARLDPPEAYLPEDSPTDSAPTGREPIRPVVRSIQQGNQRVARASGILGLSALSSLMLVPVCYLLAALSGSEGLFLVCLSGSSVIMLVCGILSITLGLYARKGGPWAVVGLVTGIMALVFFLSLVTMLILSL
jgi:hypothetical protein